MKKNAFTMIELVFVIVVLGILAAIAIPKFAATRTDAVISKGRAEVATIRSAIISERQSRLIKGETNYIAANKLDNNDGLFAGVLTYGIKSSTKSGHWSGGSGTYYYHVDGTSVKFTYDQNTGKFTCDRSQDYCSELID
jgi:general secretion pathway protein G